MAYFSNATEGGVLDAQCDECLHQDPEAACPIKGVQSVFNYTQIGNKNLKSCMNMLIDAGGLCKMKPYIDKMKDGYADLPGQQKMFED